MKQSTKRLNLYFKKLKSLWQEELPFKKRLLLSSFVWLAFCSTFLFFGPFEMIAYSKNFLTYSYRDAWLPLLVLTGLAFVVTTLLTSLLKGKIFNYVLTLAFGIVVSGYLQAAFFNGDLGRLNGDGIVWLSLLGKMVLNLCVWGAILLVVYVILFLNKKTWKNLLLFVSSLLIIMQLTGAVSAVLMNTGSNKERVFLSDEELYKYSDKENIFVFVLDRLDYDYIQTIESKNPDFFNKLDGFTSYTNAISSQARTSPALSSILTNSSDLAYKIPRDEYFEKCWTNNGKSLFERLYEQEYNVELYAEYSTLFSEETIPKKYVSNAFLEKSNLNFFRFAKKMVVFSGYKYGPLALKPFFWTDTNFYNAGIHDGVNSSIYSINDAKYATSFESATVENKKSTFKFIHLNGTHEPYIFNADGSVSDIVPSLEEHTMGCFNNLFETFDKMKDLGIYKDSTIIITADHGAPVNDFTGLLKATRIGLYLKPAGNEGTPLQVSNAPVSTANIPATILKSAGAEYSGFEKPLDEISEDEDIIRYYYKSSADSSTRRETKLYTYEVTGDASDFDNWKLRDEEDIEDDCWFY